jgi:putative tricarboxylic transport membrane protein
MLSCAQIWLSARELKRAGGSDSGGEVKKKDYMCVLRTLTLSCAYVLLLEPLGFLISSALYVFFQILNLCPKNEVNVVKFAVIAVVSSVFIYFTFRNGLHLMLPAGPLAGLF